MNAREAEQTLSVIKTLMERGTRYTNVSGHAGMAAGFLTLVGCALRIWWRTPFMSTWMGVLLAACGATVYFTNEMARSNGEPLWTRQAKTVISALMPAFISALVLTFVLARIGQEALLPGIWMLLWGVGALAMGFFTPRIMWLLGLTFMGAGIATLIAPPANDAWTMGLTFGMIHLVYGAVVAAAKHSPLSRIAVLRDFC
jgi:hypothetical protein